MAELVQNRFYQLRLTEKELNLLLKGLVNLVTPTVVTIKGDEREESADLNRRILESVTAQLKQQTEQFEAKTKKAKELAATYV
jgi:hypothetical protein